MTRYTSIGIDFVDFEEFRNFEKNARFLKKIFSSKEIEYCCSKTNPIPFLAARYALKESIVKAFGSLGKKIFYSDVEIGKRKNGSIKVLLKKWPKAKVMASLSHARQHAVAVVLVEMARKEK